jgi:hypothetical protein
MARSLERLIADAEYRRAPLRGSAIQPCREQVRNALPVMFDLIAWLRGSSPADARGVARLRAVLCDGAGPCYTRVRPDALTDALQAVVPWLEAQD